jgi:hypothetical protein
VTLDVELPPSRQRVTPVDLQHTLRALERWGSERDWAGSDPYDGLNATRLAGPLRRSRLGRRLLTQAVKRSPFDLRQPLAIPEEHDSAALAHVISAYARNGFLPPEEASSKLEQALQRLESLRCPGFDEPCWGYHFDVQTRVFFYPRGAPNSIATAFAGAALVDAYESSRDEVLLRRAEAVGDFFLRHIPQTPTDEGAYFGYLVGDRTPIHNANMLVSALLARVDAHAPRNELADAAAAGVQYTLEHQRSDGSWPYAERSGWDWVDGYHTGYILDALGICVDLRVTTADADALDRGLRFYARALFLADGTPRFTATSTYPIDIQCVAQGIQTPALAATRIPELGNLAWSVFRFARARMLRRDGAFAYQRRRFWTNRTPHVRWAAAPMLLALTHLVRMGTTE